MGIGTSDGNYYETDYDHAYAISQSTKTMTDETPDPIIPGQQYAADAPKDPLAKWGAPPRYMEGGTYSGTPKIITEQKSVTPAANENKGLDPNILRKERYDLIRERQGETLNSDKFNDLTKRIDGVERDLSKFSKQINPTPYEDALLKQSWKKLGQESSKPDLKAAEEVPKQTSRITGYRIWDNVEKKYISNTYQPNQSQRRRARSRAEKMNLDYGAHRYSSQPQWEDINE